MKLWKLLIVNQTKVTGSGGRSSISINQSFI